MTDDSWTVRRTLEWMRGYFEGKGDENPLLSAQWLLGDVCRLSRLELYTQLERPLSGGERTLLRDYVARRGRGEPLQLITGETNFRHIRLRLREGVFVPRPETEVLVSEALALLPERNRVSFSEEDSTDPVAEDASASQASASPSPASSLEEVLVADLCTGSGCIACSIAHENPASRVIATDLSPQAVVLARENVEYLGQEKRVEVLEGDLGTPIPRELMGGFDLVVSNPPYIPTKELDRLPDEVAAFDPTLALDGGEDGLDFLEPLLGFAQEALKPGGGLAIELHEDGLEKAAEHSRRAGFDEVRIVCDLAGRQRILTMRKAVA